MALTRIRMELARTDGFPEGSRAHGYEFVAPLTADGISTSRNGTRRRTNAPSAGSGAATRTSSASCAISGRAGASTTTPATRDDDEPFFKLDRHALTEGSYVSVTEHDRVQRPFRIVGDHEARMTVRNLDAVFAPKSVALIGASARPRIPSAPWWRAIS